MLYRVRIRATHKETQQAQECDRSLYADTAQAAESAGLQLLGVDGRSWNIEQLEATPAGQQRAA